MNVAQVGQITLDPGNIECGEMVSRVECQQYISLAESCSRPVLLWLFHSRTIYSCRNNDDHVNVANMFGRSVNCIQLSWFSSTKLRQYLECLTPEFLDRDSFSGSETVLYKCHEIGRKVLQQSHSILVRLQHPCRIPRVTVSYCFAENEFTRPFDTGRDVDYIT